MAQLTPIATNASYYGGLLLVFEAPESALLDQGLMEPEEAPKHAPRCRKEVRVGNDLTCAYRLPDGRIRLTISAHLVRMRDRSFVEFMSAFCAVQGVLL